MRASCLISLIVLHQIRGQCVGCVDNPDEHLDTIQIARRHGFRAESHIVETSDGYLLTLHRIPGPVSGSPKPPVFLQHGLLSSSTDWVINGPKSLAFLLADTGYDVWLGNARGNTYSKAHTSLSIDSPQYWNFTWHEMGYYDLPAALGYVTNITEHPVIYIGHSMGTTMFFVFAATRPLEAANVRFTIALAPVAYLTHAKSPIRYLAPFTSDIEWLFKRLGLNQFLPNNKMLQFLAYDCKVLKIQEDVCENVIFALCGFDRAEFNQEILPVVLAHAPAGTSTKTVLHYAQEIRNDGQFQYYDYGPEGNQIEYGTSTPPLYDLGKIEAKTYLFYALNDWLASDVDVKRLAQNLTHNVGLYEVQMKSFNHVDFLYGKDAAALVYAPLMKIIANYTDRDL